ncbi:hypothetical protein BH10PAT2_BH10PAT2_1120 [soil metagenome]
MEQTNITKTTVATESDPNEFTIAKVSQILWFVGHFIAILLALRFIFLLLGARLLGIVLVLYNITSLLVLPFRGIFPSAKSGVSYFDSSALLGIVMYYLIILLITKIISLFSKNTDA